MSVLALAFRQLRYESRAFWRNPPAALFTFAFPLMFLFIFNSVFGSRDVRLFETTVDMSYFYVPAMVTFSVVGACFTNAAITLTFARDEGVLKRVRGTPLPAASYLMGRVGHITFVSALLVAVVLAVGVLFYNVDLPDNTMPAFIVSIAVGSASFAALGFAMTGVIPNSDAAPPMVNFAVLPVLFISDLFFGPEASPDWMQRIADFFPVRHFNEALLAAFNPFETGNGFEWTHLAVVALWGLAGVVFAVRYFSWEPRR